MKTVTLASSASVPVSASERKSFTRFFPATARILLGAPLVVFGLNGFLNFIPPPSTPMPEAAMTFVTALMVSGYMMPLIAVTLIVAGALLLANRLVPFALLLLAPFFVNSLAFHFFLEPSGRPAAIVFTVLELYLAWSYRAAYTPLFALRARVAA
jgi:putative oxidoreductase